MGKLSFAINMVETDFRAEAVAAGLIENGQDDGRVLIVRHKGNRKDVAKDLDRIERTYIDDGCEDLTEYLYLYANRENIYDSLPEGLFHQPADPRKLRSKEDIINDMQTHREKEFYTRRFFQPFEMALDKIGIDARLCEQKYHRIHLYENLPGVFKERWRILQYLSPRQALLFMKLIPIISEISRSLTQTALLMSIILDCPVGIREGRKTISHLDAEERTPLGKWKLGVKSVLGKTVENDHVNMEITIGPISPAQMRTFEHHATNERILWELIEMTVPFDRPVSVKYKIVKADAGFRLSNKSHKAYLGINTALER
ncbi:MAG: type VI secretion system baseplate subunit TssG [Dysgonamonadaceae bacterium]|jgi:hypothetical protein|nr:type VI secretion system baseplate subunit TssG [Dysgonamonadaceae bacterium]